MAYKYKAVSKIKDPSNGNIVVSVDFFDENTPEIVYRDKIFAFDLTDAKIDSWARSKILVFEQRDANFEEITIGIEKKPDDIDPKLVTLIAAKKIYSEALNAAQIKSLNDTSLQDAFVALKAAEAALEE